MVSAETAHYEDPQLITTERPPEVSLIPTYNWVNVYSLASWLGEEPVPVGAVIEALDPQGTIIGAATVQHPGRYGLMRLYMDDPTTAADEGALPGDKITFKINGAPATVNGPDSPVWTANGDLLSIDLVAGEGSPGPRRGFLQKLSDGTIGRIRQLFD